MILFQRSYGQGYPVLIFHGLFGQSDNWTSIARRLSETGLQVYTLDLRNHGLSGHDEIFDYEHMAADIYETIGSLHLDKPILMGHSMGAKAILHYEYLFPAHAKALITVDMAARAYEGHHQSVIEGLNAVDPESIQTRNEADEILSRYIHDMAVRQFLLKNLHRSEADPNKLNWRFNLKIITEKYPNILKPVPQYHSSTPAFLIYGEHSGYITNDDLRDYAQRFSHFEYYEVKNCGHWVHAEKPDVFFETVNNYIHKILQ
jgi:pimeloyl-ACP methyl ester carboxylesterase